MGSTGQESPSLSLESLPELIRYRKRELEERTEALFQERLFQERLFQELASQSGTPGGSDGGSEPN